MNTSNIPFTAMGAALVLAIAGSAYAAESNDPAQAAAISAAHKPTQPHPALAAPLVTTPQTAVQANICFTCGGDWPIYAGTIPTASAANERGAGCAGSFSTTLNDHFPFLCTR